MFFLHQDIPQYREMVKQFYHDVARLPRITDLDMSNIMQQSSMNNEFDTIAALKELYIYVTKYRDQVSGVNLAMAKWRYNRNINPLCRYSMH